MNVLAVVIVMIVLIDRGFAHNDAERVELALDVARSGSVTALPWTVLLWRRTLGQNAEQRGTRWCRELSRSRRPVTDIESLEQTHRCWRGHRENSVRGFHRAIPKRDLRVIDAFDPEHLNAPDRPDDVE